METQIGSMYNNIEVKGQITGGSPFLSDTPKMPETFAPIQSETGSDTLKAFYPVPETGYEILPQVKSRMKPDIGSIAFLPPKLLQLRHDISNIVGILSETLLIEDELERESEMNLITQSIFELSIYLKINNNLTGAICLIQVCAKAHIKEIYSRPQIVAMRKVMIKMRDNIYMEEQTLDECFDILEEAGFDTNAPLSGASVF